MRMLLILILLCIGTINATSQTTTTETNPIIEQIEEFSWDNVIEAIIQIESKGNPKAVSSDGKCVGILQIKTVLVDDCNQYLRMKRSKKRFTYRDRYNREKSIEMFKLIQERYNKSNNIERGIRLWNGGCGYSKRKTDNYYKKVLTQMAKM